MWFRDWPLGRPDAPSSGEPCLVVDDRVVAATDDLRELGVVLGMPRREAEALVPGSTVLIRDAGEEMRRFEPVIDVVESLVPRVEVVEPGLLLVPIGGAIRYYGGERPLAERVLMEIGLGAGNVADGAFAARWAAGVAASGQTLIVDDTVAFLTGLDLSVLGPGRESLVDTFRWLGVTTLGDLARLPREALASRFGWPGVAAHRLASGDDQPPRPRVIPDELAVEHRFEEPLTTIDRAGFAARSLSARLLDGLRRQGVAPYRVLVEARAGGGGIRSRVWRSADPFTEAALTERVWWQLRAWIESEGVPGGIISLRLDPADLSGEGRQMGLFEDQTSLLEAERALARAQALVGPDEVVQAAVSGGRMPRDRVLWYRWGEPAPEIGEAAPWPGSTPPPSPALVPPAPPVVDIEWDSGMPTRIRLGSRWDPVLSWSGPWRMTGRWWKGGVSTNRYQLVTSAGAFLCVVTDEGTAYLAGVYD